MKDSRSSKNYFVREEEEKELEGEVLLTQLSKRVLIGEYIKEVKARRAGPRKKGENGTSVTR